MLKYSDFIAGNEAINFQMNSKLAKDLCAVFQLGIDEYNKYDPDYENMDPVDFINARAEHMHKYTGKVLAPKLKEAVYKDTLITFKSVVLVPDYGITGAMAPSMCFAVDVSMGDVRAAIATIAQMSGTEHVNPTASSLVDFMTLANNFDATTTVLKSDIFKKEKVKISTTLYFDAVSAFCMQDYVHDNADITAFTAEEITAILLHEIGHIHTLVERSGDAYYQYQRCSNMIADLKTMPDEQSLTSNEIKKMTDVVLSSFVTLQKDKFIPDKVATSVIRCLNSTTQVREYAGKESAGNIVVSTLGIIFKGLLIISMQLWATVYLIRLFYNFAIELASNIMVGNANSGNKTGDVYTTSHNSRLCERLADEFVSRNGLSGPLASGLDKLYRYMRFASSGALIISSPALRSSRSIGVLLCIIQTITSTLGWADVYNYVYEDTETRFMRMAQNSIGALKNSNAPAAMISSYIADYEAAVAVSKKRSTAFKWMGMLTSIAADLVNPAVLYRAIKDNKLSDDYVVLHDNVDKLTSNRLYYSARKLQML